MKIGEKFEKIADAVYKKGVSDFGISFDEKGTNLVTIKNVHPKEHDAKVELTSKNLINPTVFADYELQEDGSYYAPHANASKKYTFDLPAGTYTLSYQCKSQAGSNFRIALYDKNGAAYEKYLGSTGDYVSFSYTFTASADIVSIKFNWGITSEIGVYFKDLQIEKGSETTPYTPFVDAESVTVCGKNLINIDEGLPKENSPIYYTSLSKNIDGSYTIVRKPNDGSRSSEIIPVDIPCGTQITFSIDIKETTAGDLISVLYDENGVAIHEVRCWGVVTGKFKITLTTRANIKSYRIMLLSDSTSGQYIAFEKLQIEFGSFATEWEAYKCGGTYPVTDGKAIVKSVSPTMNVITPESGVTIEAKGYLDGQAVIDELSQALVDIGGEL